MVVYLDGRFLPLDEAALSPRDRGIQFADGAYEVIRSYNGVLFELDAHLARLRRSLRELRIDPSPADGLGAVCAELLERNELRETDARVYLHVTRGTYPRGHAFPPPDVAPNVYAEASSFEPHREVQLHGVSVISYPDQRWARCDIKSLALLPNVLALQAAREQGAQEAVLLRDGIVTEATHSSVAAVNEDTVIAPPLTNYVLPSITRQVVYRLCEQEGIPFVADILSAEQLRGADEAMLWGTGYEVTPITEIDRTPVGTGAPGPVTRRLQHAFRDYVARHTSSAAAEARRQPNPDPPPG